MLNWKLGWIEASAFDDMGVLNWKLGWIEASAFDDSWHFARLSIGH